MENKWNIIKVIIPFNMGELNDKRINNYKSELDKRDLIVRNTIVQNSASTILVLNDGQENLIMESHQLTYISAIQDVFNIQKIEERLNAVLDAYLLENSNNYVFNIEGQQETQDSHSESVTSFKKLNNIEMGNVFGVGYRFFMATDTYVGDLKFEPMISNKEQYFIQMQLFMKDKMPLHNAIEIIKSEFDKDYNSYLQFK